jgi:hypothetical protein
LVTRGTLKQQKSIILFWSFKLNQLIFKTLLSS